MVAEDSWARVIDLFVDIHEVVDRQLVHLHRSKIDQAYKRARFLPERNIMMQE